MIIVVIAGIILAVVMFKLLLPLLGEMVGVIIGGLLLLGAIALCVAFPPIIILFLIIGFIIAGNKKTKDKQ
ncbi:MULTISPECIES: hypothetical protein [Pseudomonas]|jgi:uncharacterized membrane protein YoaK (UPF0700 family)|uniref:Uncharacterized protein n=1 Tax=Pseudomonas veronii TaxID=76761 RepID=A0A0R3B9D3_PSEVE|nr:MULTISPECIES: hypothetical protein [Pseudomonas]SEC34024.1 hypothetical protein SAMN04490199_4746 [Pseudomonas marginalis]AQY66668.1 hypothetical protein PverR02_16980 [Pseudomonas veronii]KRP78430.1 hypothetical protein TU80_12840 [Pseudomonas veronii]MBI6551173.1 hypothetical protein [Pseudomonas veronii]MBI6652228.1 hypothetical protein [Pseudomonas veronii]